MSKRVIYFLLSCVSAVVLISLITYSFPSWSKNFERSTRIFSNFMPLVLAFVALVVQDEIRNWRYKKRSEAASEIISKFRVCGKELKSIIDKRHMTPLHEQEVAERRIQPCINTYIEFCLEPSSEFPIKQRKQLDEHFARMRQKGEKISTSIYIDVALPSVNEQQGTKAIEEINSFDSFLLTEENLLDGILGEYLNKW